MTGVLPGVSGVAEKSLVLSANDDVFLSEFSGETAQILESTLLGEMDKFLTRHVLPQVYEQLRCYMPLQFLKDIYVSC